MKAKKLMALFMTTALVSQGSVLMAQDQIVNMEVETIQNTQVVEAKSEYITKVGQITEINPEGEYLSVLVGTPIDGVRYIVENNELIIDAGTLGYLQPSYLKVGMEITVVVPKNAPMTMSLPAMISDQTVMIVNSSEANIDVSYYDHELVNEEHTLQLNIGRDTYITNTKGEKRIFTEEDIQNRNAVVIYTTTTRSIPPQTSPKMVLILPSTSVVETQIQETTSPVEQRAMTVEEAEYVAVRDLAVKNGYEVTWDHKAKCVTLVKGDDTIILTVGEKEYTQNGVVKPLQNAVKIENQKVYVTNDLF